MRDKFKLRLIPKTYDDTILSCYISGKLDPQRVKFTDPNNFSYIKNWWETLNDLHINGIIFHDKLDKRFITRYTTKFITFKHISTGPYSVLDERYFIYYNYLKNCPYKRVFLTDLQDVTFHGDPFKLINDQHDIYVGSEPKTIGQALYITYHMDKLYGKSVFTDKMAFNAGIIGGTVPNVIKFLDLFLIDLNQLKSILTKSVADNILEENGILSGDMAVLNNLIYTKYDINRIGTGYPLHSKFQAYENDSKACIIHK